MSRYNLKVMHYLYGELGLAMIRTFIVRVIAMLGSVALLLTLGRLYGAEGVGVFALAQSFTAGGAILSKRGMDSALMRFVGRDLDSEFVVLYLRWAILRCLYACFPIVVFLWLLRDFLEGSFNVDGLSSVMTGMALALPAISLSFIFAGFLRGVRKPAAASSLENGSISLIMTAFVLLWEWGGAGGVELIGYSYALAAWFVVLQGGGQLWLWFHVKEQGHMQGGKTVAVSLGEFSRTSRAFLVTNLSALMQTVLAVMVAGWLLDGSDLGIFKSAQQVGMLAVFPLIVINAVFPSRFAKLYYENRMSDLNALARRSSLLSVLMTSPLVLFCLFFPGWILGLFGEDFVRGEDLLRIIVSAQFINAATGSVGFLLNMTGNEKLMRNISLVSGAFGVVIFFFFINAWGVLGAAMALACVLMMQNIVALVFVWRRLGVWMLPGPNIFILLGLKVRG
ncbi:MAG: hypothetical protein LAT61_15630 [Alcanivorax sp.]|nr:hypothetical protein [Alcanivorax sp.]